MANRQLWRGCTPYRHRPDCRADRYRLVISVKNDRSPEDYRAQSRVCRNTRSDSRSARVSAAEWLRRSLRWQYASRLQLGNLLVQRAFALLEFINPPLSVDNELRLLPQQLDQLLAGLLG